MTQVIGTLLPLALGVAVSPVPIIAVILMLLSPRPGPTSLGFLLGWVAGIVIVTTLFVVLASVVGLSSGGEPSTAASWITIALGALLVLLCGKQWRSRPAAGEAAALPSWMKAVDNMSAGKSLGLGFLLSAVNPKNLAMCVAAGVQVAAADLVPGDVVVVVVVFTVLAASTVALPVVAYLVAADRMREPLNDLRDWLVQNNATVMAVLLAVIGVVLIGKGITALG